VTANKDDSTADRECIIQREFDAPAGLLFLAWTKPEYITRWFGPVGYPVTMCEMDFRVGGKFRFAMTAPDGTLNTPFGGTYREIVPDKKIVFDNGFESHGAGRMVVTVTFEESRDRTLLTVHTVFESVAMRNEHLRAGFVEGSNSGLDQLTGVVASMLQKENQ